MFGKGYFAKGYFAGRFFPPVPVLVPVPQPVMPGYFGGGIDYEDYRYERRKARQAKNNRAVIDFVVSFVLKSP